MRRALLVAALLLSAPGTAVASPYGELPSLPVSGAASCLRATGAPGELVRLARDGAEFLQASPAGLAPAGTLSGQAEDSGCPQVVSRASGAGLYAFSVDGAAETSVRARLREAGGAWGPAVDVLTPPAESLGRSIAPAVNDRGDALVAVSAIEDDRLRILVSRRVVGGGFAPAETLEAGRVSAFGSTTVRAGLSAGGDAVVAWAAMPAAGGAREVRVAVAAPGAKFGTPRRLGTLRAGSPFELAVADDGRALLALPTDRGLEVAEREPGGPFGAPIRVAAASDRFAVIPAVRLRADGAAIVAWTGFYATTVSVLSRTGPGAFGTPVVLGGAPSIDFSPYDPLVLSVLGYYASAFGIELGGDGGLGAGETGSTLSAAFAPDGRAVLTWSGPQRRDGVWWMAARSATIGLAGGTAEVRTHGAELRDAGAVTAVSLSDGATGVAWTDNAPGSSRGRLHLASEGAADGADPGLQVHVGAPASRAVRENASVALPVTCSAACDVRVQLAGQGFEAGGELSLAGAGRGTVRVTSSLRPIARLDGGPVRFIVRYGSAGARHAVSRTFSVKLRRVRVAPTRVLGLTARRKGDSVVVSWRTERPVGTDEFSVFGTATTERDAKLLSFDDIGSTVPAERKTRFSLTLEGAKAVRWVTVLTDSDLASRTRRWTSRVTG